MLKHSVVWIKIGTFLGTHFCCCTFKSRWQFTIFPSTSTSVSKITYFDLRLEFWAFFVINGRKERRILEIFGGNIMSKTTVFIIRRLREREHLSRNSYTEISFGNWRVRRNGTAAFGKSIKDGRELLEEESGGGHLCWLDEIAI